MSGENGLPTEYIVQYADARTRVVCINRVTIALFVAATLLSILSIVGVVQLFAREHAGQCRAKMPFFLV